MVSHKDVNYAIRAFASLTAISSVLNRMTCAVVLTALNFTETKSYNQSRAGYMYATAVVWLDISLKWFIIIVNWLLSWACWGTDMFQIKQSFGERQTLAEEHK